MPFDENTYWGDAATDDEVVADRPLILDDSPFMYPDHGLCVLCKEPVETDSPHKHVCIRCWIADQEKYPCPADPENPTPSATASCSP